MNKIKNTMIWYDSVRDTILSPVWVAVGDKGLVAVEIGGSEDEFVNMLCALDNSPVGSIKSKTEVVVRQIREYLLGARMSFNLPIDWSVLSGFQHKALKAVYAIPYGETCTYGQIAAQIGNPRASRAVGRANATNPIPLVIPCHRVIGADGSLRGYGAGDGVRTKAWLLDLEKRGQDTLNS
jgi:methylated-DNA-[protein]-cysteine S-methyltransferase